MNQAALDGRGLKAGVGGLIERGDHIRCAAEKFNNRAITEIQLVSFGEVGDGSEGYDACGVAIGGETKGEMATSGVTKNNHGIAEFLLHRVETRENVIVCSGPSTAGLADTTVFETGDGDAFASESGAEMAGVLKIVAGSPEASVDHHGGTKGFVLGTKEVKKL